MFYKYTFRTPVHVLQVHVLQHAKKTRCFEARNSDWQATQVNFFTRAAFLIQVLQSYATSLFSEISNECN